MKVLVCSDRNWTNKKLIKHWLKTIKPTVVIHGNAKGADTLAGEVANELKIPVTIFAAQWNIYGRAAGPLRNKEMIEKGHPDFVLAFHNHIAESKGTSNMIQQASKAKIPYKLITE